ncbi:MAG: arginine deiminase family protein [Actinomycetes bacterium]|nr:MAG: dimethylargininase [Actinomycetota bacterium]
MPRAFVREVPDSFVDALTMGERPVLDVARAREQHAAYRRMLEGAGYEVTVIPADENCPDCPFIEDTAVVLDGFAIATRPGADTRKPEVGPVAEALSAFMPVHRITEPATIDGGDVMRVGKDVFIGISARTDQEGIRQFASFAEPHGFRVVGVPVSRVLHLKSAVVPLDDGTLLIASDCVDPAAFAGYRLVEKPPAEKTGSALRLHDGRVAVTANTPGIIAAVEAAGFKVVPTDTTEFQKADGGLTCLSLLFD